MKLNGETQKQKAPDANLWGNQGYDQWDPYGECEWHLWGVYCLEEEELKHKADEI